MKPCPQCNERKYLDLKTDYGGARYVDRYAIECVWCGIHATWVYSIKEALEMWEKFAEEKKETTNADTHHDS